MTREENRSDRGLLRRLDFGDAVIFFYALAIIRQYFWILPHNRIAWLLSFAVAALFIYFYVSTKQILAARCELSFWILLLPTLLFAYSLRVAFPDRSYDVWAYHLLNSDRSLHGPLYAAGDYFPTALPFNPLPDTVTGLTRMVLGFRLGTIINLIVLLWSAQIIDRLLRPYISRGWFRSAAVLLVVLAEHLLFEISTYMVDLLTLPLLLQATLLTLNSDEAEDKRRNFIHIGLLLGAAVAFKLTNLAVAIPLLAICAYKLLHSYRQLGVKPNLATTVLMSIAFATPVLPFTIYIYRLTHNPVFPVANTFFQSAFWPTHKGWDDRWGPIGFWETIAWPVIVWFKPERHSELGVYSGRLSLGFLVAIAAIVLAWRNERLRTMCIVLLASSFLWGVAAMGYARYGLLQDALSGIILFAVVATLIAKTSWRKISVRWVIAILIVGVLGLQSYFALRYFRIMAWGSRETFLDRPTAFAEHAKSMLRDHSLIDTFTREERAQFAQVHIWLETAPQSTGFEVLLNRHAPIIAVRQREFFVTQEAWRQFIAKVHETGAHDMYSLCLTEDLDSAKQAIASRGLEVENVIGLSLPYFSPKERINMRLIQVRLPKEAEALDRFERAWTKASLSHTAYREKIEALNPPSEMHATSKGEIRLRIKNLGSESWPAIGTKDFRYQVNVGNRWVANGVTSEDNRAVLKADLAPGAETEVTFIVNAPAVPGDYILEFDMVHEGVNWFKERGATPLLIPVRVVR